MIALLGLTLLSLAAEKMPDPMEQLEDVQITGWSADETRFSVRAFQPYRGDGGDEMPDCPGYTDQNGNHFNGALILAAYDDGKLLKSWVVQDYPVCTSPEKAKATLNEAKAEFAKLGIDLTKKGTRLPCEKGCDLKHGGASFVFENKTKSTGDEESMEGTFKGSVRLLLKSGKTKTELFASSFNQTFSRIMGGHVEVGVRPVEVSPSGKRLWVRAYIDEKGGRGASSTQLTVGLFEWKGDTLEAK